MALQHKITLAVLQICRREKWAFSERGFVFISSLFCNVIVCVFVCGLRKVAALFNALRVV